MLIKIQARQTGKSHDLGQIMKKDKSAILIVHNYKWKIDFARKYKIDGERIFTMSDVARPEFRHKLPFPKKSKIYMDEVGMCLEVLTGQNIEYGTHTNE